MVPTDAGREEDSDLTETESEPAPVEPVIVKPLPQSGHEDPQPSTSSSSFHFYNMPLSTCSGNYSDGPRCICTFVQVALIRKLLLLFKCKSNGFFLLLFIYALSFSNLQCFTLSKNAYVYLLADVSAKKNPVSSLVVRKAESEMTAPAGSPGEPVMNHTCLKWTCWTEGGQQTEPEVEIQRKRRKIDRGAVTHSYSGKTNKYDAF